MRGSWLWGASILALAVAVACGASNDPGDDGPKSPGGSGGGPPDSGLGSGGTAGGEFVEPPIGQTTEGENAGGSGATGASFELDCSGLPQNARIVETTIAGNNASGSAVEARETLSQDPPQAPIPSHLSTQEFINHYAPSFPTVSETEPAVHLQLRHSGVPKHFDLLVAIQAPAPAERPRGSLTIVVDNTESMGGGIERARAALRAIAAELAPGDGVQWLTAAADAAPQTFVISGPDDPALVSAIDALGLEPERELAPLLESAYTEASARLDPSAWNRVLLVSDGAHDPAALPELIAASANAGPAAEIRLSALGTGPARANGHRLLRAATRLGRGAYRYLDDAAATAANLPKLDELFGVALDAVSLELELPWYFAVERPFVGAIVDTDVPIEPQYVAPGGTMMFLFRLIACSETATTDYLNEEPLIEARFSWISAADGSARSASATGSPHVLADQTPAEELVALLTVTGYAEALRSLDKKRLEQALTLAEKNTSDPAQVEIAGLLKRHPLLTQEPLN